MKQIKEIFGMVELYDGTEIVFEGGDLPKIDTTTVIGFGEDECDEACILVTYTDGTEKTLYTMDEVNLFFDTEYPR